MHMLIYRWGHTVMYKVITGEYRNINFKIEYTRFTMKELWTTISNRAVRNTDILFIVAAGYVENTLFL